MCKNNCIDGKIALLTSVVDCEICTVNPCRVFGDIHFQNMRQMGQSFSQGTQALRDMVNRQADNRIHRVRRPIDPVPNFIDPPYQTREQGQIANFARLYGGGIGPDGVAVTEMPISTKIPEPPTHSIKSHVRIPFDEVCYMKFDIQLTEEMARRIANKLDEKIING